LFSWKFLDRLTSAGTGQNWPLNLDQPARFSTAESQGKADIYANERFVLEKSNRTGTPQPQFRSKFPSPPLSPS
jgi:hypothetical protein